MKNKKLYYLVFFSFIVLAAITLACWKIGQPGLYYDELLFGNAAVGGKTDVFVRRRILGIPVLLMDYIGALKAWIYYPIFSVFPVNYWTVRVPSILLGIGGGAALVAALWKGFGRTAAVTGAVMILLDPTLITHSRLDWGPNALMFFFRGIMVWSIVSCVRTGKVRWAWLAMAAAMLGIFDKLNFIWFVSASIGSLIVVYFNELKEFARIRARHGLVLAVIGAVGIGAAFIRAVKMAEHTDNTWSHRIGEACRLIRFAFTGGGALDFISGDGMRLEPWIWAGYLPCIILGALGLKVLYRNRADKRLHLWSVFLFLIVSIAFFLTKTATGPHHSSMLSGLWQFILAPMAGAWVEDKESLLPGIRSWIMRAALLLIFIINVRCTVICIRSFAFPRNANWDPANTEAALYAKGYPEATFISTDWGIGTQAIALARDRPILFDAWPTFIKQDDADNYIKYMPRDRDTYIYTRLPGFENFKGNRANLIHALNKNHICYEVVKNYINWRGKAMIEIWEIPSIH